MRRKRKLVFANRLHGEGVKYYNPYQKKKLGILEGEKNFFKDGYFSDGAYLIKTIKPKIKREFKEESPDMKKFIKEVNDSVKGPAEIIAELYDADNSLQEDIVMAHVRSKDKSIEAFFNIKYIDSILTMYPTANIFIKDNQSTLLFKFGKAPVACVMPIRSPEFSEYIIKRMEKNK
uniref:Uncharacterized protein n=1 Tax=viral metagenome TaxID=1070528 RepID=A0A6M3L838_9ZZZZ